MFKRRIVLWVVCTYSVASYIVTMVLNIVLCNPVPGNWALDQTEVCVPNISAILFQLSWALHFSSDVMRTSLSFHFILSIWPSLQEIKG
jgi:hypothetical protein